MLGLLCKATLPALLVLPPPSRVAGDSATTCDTDSGPCGVAAGGGAYYWPTQKGTVGRTGFSPHPPPDISKEPTWAWTDPHEDVIRATPLIDDKLNVYLSTVAGRIYKFDAGGKTLWKRELVFNTPTVGSLYEGKFIIATRIGHVVALDMETGEIRWLVPVSKMNHTAGDPAALLVHRGLVVSATLLDFLSNGDGGNSEVVAVRADSGAVAWHYSPEVNVHNFQACTPGDGSIFFQDRAGALYRLNLTDGRELWKSGKLTMPWRLSVSTGAPVCHEGKVFVVSNGALDLQTPTTGFLHVYRLEDGMLLWEQELAYRVSQAVAVGPHPSEKGKSIAVVGFGQNPGSPSAPDAGMKYGRAGSAVADFVDRYLGWAFVKNPAAMAAYDTETGDRLWHYELPPYRKCCSAGDVERMLKRLTDALTNNTSNEVFCLPNSCSQPVLGPDGTVYQGWQDGRIYAVKDANGDGKIDDGEVAFRQLSDGFYGSLAMAPGMLAAAPCGGGLYVWRS